MKLCDIETRFIAVKLIDVIPVAKGTGTFSRAFAANLAVAIAHEGLLNPITVRPHPTIENRFQLVAGRHRLYAVKTINGEDMIACHIVDMSDAEAEIAGISENLWRHDASKTQKIKSIQIWHAHYAARQSEAATLVATPESQAKILNDMRGEEPKAKPIAKLIEEAATAPTAVSNAFVATARVVTKESRRTIKRHVNIAKTFSPDDLEVFEAQGLTTQQIELIAAEKDLTKRNEFVNLVASGLCFEETYKAIHGIKPDLTATSKEVKAEVQAAYKETNEELTDDTWFDQHCGEKADLIRYSAKYYTAAILYRHVATARAKFRSSIKKCLAAQKAIGHHHNPLWFLLNRVTSLSHPKDFHLCNSCQGRCTEGDIDDQECRTCYGAGFQLTTEQYL